MSSGTGEHSHQQASEFVGAHRDKPSCTGYKGRGEVREKLDRDESFISEQLGIAYDSANIKTLEKLNQVKATMQTEINFYTRKHRTNINEMITNIDYYDCIRYDNPLEILDKQIKAKSHHKSVNNKYVVGGVNAIKLSKTNPQITSASTSIFS